MAEEEGAEARLRTLRAVEAGLRAEVASARLKLHETGDRLRAPPDPDAARDGGKDPEALRLARCEVRQNNARTISQLQEAEIALKTRLEETRARVAKRKTEEHDLRALADELNKENNLAVARRSSSDPMPPVTQDEAEENEKLQRVARIFLANHFSVPGDLTFWKRFLRMPYSVDLAGADEASSVVNCLLASGLCAEPDEDSQDHEDPPPVGTKRLLVVSAPNQ
ncbi:Hypothetical Protein FCC1311_049652 [Hondaea fermentalgiana]|uniref:Uncharacterized protein n=1 Tax=Hondaea fermentalgiana TaxID=2315210 RepID=A0A2R5GLI8_9STRA|nr:Hypothetical Protein FCC1311_049652 [Hondaea fermentalgiana]|eukprot:GBG28744.1 Hypothetical Protein FCC1311_049652 [Hondaea fermentalgiana]